MVDEDRQGHIPGYTGHLRRGARYEQAPTKVFAASQIPGYCGFIKGVKSENMFGSTYGRTTEQSAGD
eukprot:CAMPEP_0201281580 /NCGR_PEP_ID=MMETSP1317-20130820/3402_1 /ASSEMBLY_ACC=CAM_ASM_000770 /TAXON_ID=187299 /ORGANISM="Undescribed Undescribed, Strain Undescribed" /LENGTH=66 /DNA_ID=CAMNT_0047591825 /DNA_START=14 /DNA_END=214 /DNA_ORIENTATION=-